MGSGSRQENNLDYNVRGEVLAMSAVDTRSIPLPRADESAKRVPPLENGDRLTRAEFEQRYRAMPRINKAELIEGEAHMPSPVKVDHSRSHGQIMGWLAVYSAATPGVTLYDNTTVRLDPENEVQPDACLRLEPAQGGHSHISADGYVEGAPELIVEIASSSAAIDMHTKFKVYRRNEVQEYLVWQVLDQKIEWFELQEGNYVPLAPNEQGVIHSRVFPGLRLPVTAMLNDDLAAVLAEVQRGLADEAHARFAASLPR